MRRNASFALAVCLLAVTGAQPAAASAPGDLNDDGVWDARDALLLEQYLRSEVTLGAAQLAAADVAPLGRTTTTAGDGVVDAGDLVVLLRFLANDDLDGDGLSAAFEVAHGYLPLVTDEDGNGVLDGLDDDDQDGLSNTDEERMGFDPRNADSHGDGVIDSLELASVPSQAVATNASTSTEFLFDQTEKETTPLQTGAETAELDPDVLAVLRGTVRTRAGELLAGVRVSILGRPEFGTTTTRVDGMFDLVVNGGATLTVVYDHPEFLAVQRKATVPWQDYYTLPDVVLVPLDTKYTDIDPSQAPAIQVARGSISTDTAGTRRPTLLFRQGTVTTATLPDDTTQPLAELRVRATEYTVGDSGPEAMPGELPPQVAYTYAVEFTVDQARALGAKQVRFSLPGAPEPIASYPVSAYLENFLDLPVGTTMPNGYYDHEKGAWLPEKSGVVLAIVGITGGMADLDIDGDSQPDDTSSLAITSDERTKLAELFDVNDELWWVPLSHFSDFNVGPVFETPDIKPGEPVADGETPPGQTEICSASTIVCESQVLIETVPVAGTPFVLSYASDRTPGYTANYTMRFPLRDVSVLTSNVLGVTLEVSVAGQKYAYRYTPAEVNANGKQVVEWDGRDAYGRVLQGRQAVKAELTYEYGFQYQDVPIFGQSGDGTPILGAQPRTRTSIRQPWFGFVGGWDARGSGLGGWTLSPHHAAACCTQETGASGVPSSSRT
ncbi:MAG: dockerin type I repeat-containing protein [Myxococcota bacterium]|nr:dockerin type I repeat-containing protein [Myxococcota bacterium]